MAFGREAQRSFAASQGFTRKMILDIVRYVAVAVLIYILGMCGIVLGRKNIIITLMSIELMLLAVNLNLLIFSVYIDDLMGQFFALLILTVAAAESAIGLAILVIYFRIRGTILVQFMHFVKG
jgi:NADH:ubiquinone oxidoreductase subunit K